MLILDFTKAIKLIDDIVRKVEINGRIYQIEYLTNPKSKFSYWFIDNKSRKVGIVNLDPYREEDRKFINFYLYHAKAQLTRN